MFLTLPRLTRDNEVTAPGNEATDVSGAHGHALIPAIVWAVPDPAIHEHPLVGALIKPDRLQIVFSLDDARAVDHSGRIRRIHALIPGRSETERALREDGNPRLMLGTDAARRGSEVAMASQPARGHKWVRS